MGLIYVKLPYTCIIEPDMFHNFGNCTAYTDWYVTVKLNKDKKVHPQIVCLCKLGSKPLMWSWEMI